MHYLGNKIELDGSENIYQHSHFIPMGLKWKLFWFETPQKSPLSRAISIEAVSEMSTEIMSIILKIYEMFMNN